jgi:RNA polymerase sigma-70 factor, ECF subfamily
MEIVRSDEELVRGLGGSEADAALRALYRVHARPLYGYALRRLGDRGLAEEAVQEVFTRLWRGAATFDPAQGSARTWLYGIARHVVIDLERRRAVRPGQAAHDGAFDEPADEPTDEPIERALLRWQIRAALDRLSPEHRQVITMCHFEALSLREISGRTGVPLGTVKSRLSYALRNLRLALEEMGVLA